MASGEESPWLERIASLEEEVREAVAQVQTVEFAIKETEERVQKQYVARKPYVIELETLKAKRDNLVEIAKAQRQSEAAEDRRAAAAKRDCSGLARSISALKETTEHSEGKVLGAEALLQRRTQARESGKSTTKDLQTALVETGEAKEPLTTVLDAEREKQRNLKVQMEGKIARMREDYRERREAAEAAAKRTALIREEHAAAEASLEATRESLDLAAQDLTAAETACRTKQREKDMWRSSLREVRRVNERLRAELREVTYKVQESERARDDLIRSRCQAHLEKLDKRLAARSLAQAQPVVPGVLA
jgi:chromosome segregation ATPase